MKIVRKIKEKGIFKFISFLICAPTYILFKSLYSIILNKLPVDNNYVLFMSTPDFSDNAKALYEYMNMKKKYPYKYIWLVNEKPNVKNIGENTIFIKNSSKYHHGLSLKALYYIAKSKILFHTHGSPMQYIKEKKGQLVINLWHGCGYKDSNARNKCCFDYALVPGNIFVETKSKFWSCNKNQILTIGYPRYDLLLRENDETYSYVKKLKGNNEKFIIWMPTFRKTIKGNFPEEKIDSLFDLPVLQSKEDVKKLNELCKNKKIVLCIKRHQFQLKYEAEDMQLSNILFIDNNDLLKENIDLYSLLKYTDGLISDYSSVAIDYLLLDKPIGFILADYEEYASTRGFVFENPKKYMPGYHIYTFEEFEKCISEIALNIDRYKEERNLIMNEVHNRCNNYCERICNTIEEILEENKNE